MMQTALTMAIWGAVILFVFLVYFWPALTAFRRKHQATGGITLVNALLGWTLIGWLVAMVWAYSDERR